MGNNIENEILRDNSEESTAVKLESKQKEAIAEIKEDSKGNELPAAIVKVGVISRLGEVIDEVFKEPVKDYVSTVRGNIGPAAKAAVSAAISLIPVAGTATSDASVAAKGADTVAEGTKVATKGVDAVVDTAKGAKGVIGKLAIPKGVKDTLKGVAKTIDPTPDVPAWVTVVSSAAGKAGVPFIDVGPEAIQLAIIGGKNLRGYIEMNMKFAENAYRYRMRRLKELKGTA